MSEPYIDWFSLIAADRGLPQGWTWFHSKWVGEGQHAVMLIKGGVAGHVYARGPNKGKPCPKKRTDVSEMVVTRDDMKAIKAKWERETGKCSGCYGKGKTVASIHVTEGKTYRDCSRCKATGNAVQS